MGSVGKKKSDMPTIPEKPKTNAELASDFTKKTGISVSPKVVSKIDNEVFASVLGEIERQIDTYGKSVIGITRLDSVSKSGVFATAIDTSVSLNLGYYRDKKILEYEYDKSVKSHFHPEGTQAVHIISHELGHVANAGILTQIYGNPHTSPKFKEWIADWNKRKTATYIRDTAIKKIKANFAEYGFKSEPNATDLIKSISGYATKNSAEALAEAWADVTANGANAKLLSRVIHEVANDPATITTLKKKYGV